MPSIYESRRDRCVYNKFTRRRLASGRCRLLHDVMVIDWVNNQHHLGDDSIHQRSYYTLCDI